MKYEVPVCHVECADTSAPAASARVSEMLDYSAEDLTGRSLYTLCHGADAHLLRKAHVDRKWPRPSLRCRVTPRGASPPG